MTKHFDQTAYTIQYNKENVITKRVPFNRQNPADMKMLEWVTAQGNFTAYVKALIKQDMERSNTP
jgi:hypothetical protein